MMAYAYADIDSLPTPTTSRLRSISGLFIDQYPDTSVCLFTFTPTLTALVPRIQAESVQHLDISEDGGYRYTDHTIEELRSALMGFTAVEILMVNACLQRLRVLEGGSGLNGRDSILFPALRHLIVHRPAEGFKLATETLEYEWAVVHRVVKHRAELGVPIVITLSGWMDFPGFEGGLEAFKKVDAEGLHLLAGLVDKVEDRRVWKDLDEENSEIVGPNSKRILESYRD